MGRGEQNYAPGPCGTGKSKPVLEPEAVSSSNPCAIRALASAFGEQILAPGTDARDLDLFLEVTIFKYLRNRP